MNRSSNCELAANVYGEQDIAIITNQQWKNSNGVFVVEYMFNVREQLNGSIGAVGLMLFNFRGICEYYYIAISPTENAVFLRRTAHNGSVIELAINTSVPFTFNIYYQLRLTTVNNKRFLVSINDIEYINYLQIGDDESNIDRILSGYIGIMSSHLTVNSKSLYVSGGNVNKTSTDIVLLMNQCPTLNPTLSPTISPTTTIPTASTAVPSKNPSTSPTTTIPTKSPTNDPSTSPTKSPTSNPTASPTTAIPTTSPTGNPSASPTRSPTTPPTDDPSTALTAAPSTIRTSNDSNPSSAPTSKEQTTSILSSNANFHMFLAVGVFILCCVLCLFCCVLLLKLKKSKDIVLDTEIIMSSNNVAMTGNIIANNMSADIIMVKPNGNKRTDATAATLDFAMNSWDIGGINNNIDINEDHVTVNEEGITKGSSWNVADNLFNVEGEFNDVHVANDDFIVEGDSDSECKPHYKITDGDEYGY